MLRRYDYNEHSIPTKDIIRAPAADALANFQRTHHANNIVFPYWLNEDDIRSLNICFPRRVVSMSSLECELRDSSHPVAAALLYYAKITALAEANCYSDFIDIGSSFSDILSSHDNMHGCVLTQSARDLNRYLNHLSSAQTLKRDATELKKIREIERSIFANETFNHRLPDGRASFCNCSSQRCATKSKFAISIHSLYDMTPLDVANIFNAHDLQTLTAWLFLPQELMYGIDATRARKYQNMHNWYTYTTSGNDSIMGFNDRSFVYRHNTQTWRDWCTTTLIDCKSFQISVEITHSYGPMHCLRFTRIPKYATGSLERLWSTDYLNDFVLVPDITDYVLNGCARSQAQLMHILVPKKIWFKGCLQALKPAVLDGNTIIQFMAGITQRIDVGTVTINNSIEMGVDEFYRFCQSMVFMMMAQRHEYSENFTAITSYLRLHSAHSGWFTQTWMQFRELVNDICSFTRAGIHKTSLYGFTSYEFRDVHCANRVSVSLTPTNTIAPTYLCECGVNHVGLCFCFNCNTSVQGKSHLCQQYDFNSKRAKYSCPRCNAAFPGYIIHNCYGVTVPETKFTYNGIGGVVCDTAPRLLFVNDFDAACCAAIIANSNDECVVGYVNFISNKSIHYGLWHTCFEHWFSTCPTCFRFWHDDQLCSYHSRQHNLRNLKYLRSEAALETPSAPPAPLHRTAAKFIMTSTDQLPVPSAPVQTEPAFISTVDMDPFISLKQYSLTDILQLTKPSVQLQLPSFDAQAEVDKILSHTVNKCAVCWREVFIACECGEYVCQTHANHCSKVRTLQQIDAAIAQAEITLLPTEVDHKALRDKLPVRSYENVHHKYQRVAVNYPNVIPCRKLLPILLSHTLFRPTMFYSLPLDQNFDSQCALLSQTDYDERVSQLPSYRYVSGNRAATKLQQMLNYWSNNACDMGHVLDIGAAPGSASEVFRQFKSIITGIEHPDERISKRYRKNYHQIFTLDVNDINLEDDADFDFAYCDIGGLEPWLDTIDNVLELIYSFPSASAIVKMFLPDSENVDLCKFAVDLIDVCLSRYDIVDVYKPPLSGENNSEYYIFLSGRAHVRNYAKAAFDKIANQLYLMENRRRFVTRRLLHSKIHPVLASGPSDIHITPLEISISAGEMEAVRLHLQRMELTPKINHACKVASELYIPTKIDVALLSGVPGCGKTRHYKQIMNDDTVIVCPTTDLKDALLNELGATAHVFTQHTIFTVHQPIHSLIIDEAYMFTVAEIMSIIAHAKTYSILLVGDPMQIPPLGFSPHLKYCRTLHRFAKTINNNTTYRSAHDATSLLHDAGYADINTYAAKTTTISCVQCTPAAAQNIIKTLGFPVTTYNNDSSIKHHGRTVHCNQGLTVPNLILYVDPKSIETGLLRSSAHIRVALSRHTDNLLILGSADGFVKTIFHDNSILEVNNARFQQSAHDVDLVA
jgi:hypothetical protein